MENRKIGKSHAETKSQVSRIENGHNLTVATIVRAFKAMGVTAAFSFGGVSPSLC